MPIRGDAVVRGTLSPALRLRGLCRSLLGWSNSRQEPHAPAPVTGDLRTSLRFLAESDPCCATEQSVGQRHPFRRYTAARRECRGAERLGCLSRSRLPSTQL